MFDEVQEPNNPLRPIVENEERLRFATEAADLFAWEFDRKEKKVIWGANAALVIGCPVSMLSADPTSANFFVHPEDRDGLKAKFRHAVANGDENFEIVFRGNSTDTSRLFWKMRGRIIRDDDNVVTRVIAATQNITVQKVVEDAMRLGMERLETAEEAGGAIVYDVDLAADRVWRSKSAARILGWSVEEIGTKQSDWAKLRHPQDNEKLEKLSLSEYLQSNDSYVLEYRLKHRDGHYVWLMDSGKVFRDAKGKIVRIAGASIDISHRKKIQSSINRMANLIDLSFEPIFAWHPKKGIVEWNRGAENLYGFSKAEALGWSSHVLLKTHSRVSQDELMQILKTEKTWTGELEHRAKDGRRIFVESRHQAIESDGEWVIMETNHDITQRREAEAFNARMAAIALASHDALFGISMDGIIETWNPACTRLFGYSANEAIGQHVRVLAEASQHTQQMQFIKEAGGDNVVGPFEARRLRRDGSQVYVSVALAPVKAIDGTTVAISVAMHDVTDRREWESQLRFLNLELAHRSKNSFAVLQGILRSTLRTAASPQAFADAFEGRLHSLAKAQDILSENNWKGAELGALARLQLSSYVKENDHRIDISGPITTIATEYAAPFCLIFNELATNAVKFGALSVPTGNVQLYWRVRRHPNSTVTVFLTWRERGGPPPSPDVRPRFGATLIGKSLAGAKIDTIFESEGFTCTIEILLNTPGKVKPYGKPHGASPRLNEV